jgi:hypothetical protein
MNEEAMLISRDLSVVRLFVAAFIVMLGISPANALGAKTPPKKVSRTAAKGSAVKHVVLLGIDGFHALDLEIYVNSHPDSALARLKRAGTTYTNAYTTSPSDSFPGVLAMVTGGTPYSTGIYYETSYDRSLSPAGSKCETKGTTIFLDETIDINPDAFDGGGGVSPEKLPRDGAKGCSPVFPHDLLRVNTIFEVIKAAGMPTAWADKQPGYEMVNGPSGHGVDDLFTPELHFNASSKSLEKIKIFDDLRLNALLNEIDGKDHAGTRSAPVPAIMGMTFQAVTVGQKLKAGMGYADTVGTPSAPLLSAMDYVDGSIAKIIAAIEKNGLASSTAVIISAKHGQSPIDISKKQIVDQKIIPDLLNGISKDLVAQASGADIMLVWLSDPGKTQESVAVLKAHEKEAHIQRVLSGDALQLRFPNAAKDSRAPDLVIEPEFGVIYAKPTNQGIAEHGGFLEEDTHVPLLVVHPGGSAAEVRAAVHTTQIAPSILKLLGLDPNQLKAVEIEKTQVLPMM